VAGLWEGNGKKVKQSDEMWQGDEYSKTKTFNGIK